MSVNKEEINTNFGKALRNELDAIGFDATESRFRTLAKSLGVSPSQAYRFISGRSIPTLASMIALRSLGVSIDRLLDGAFGRMPPETQLRFGNDRLSVVLQASALTQQSSVFALEGQDGTMEAHVLQPGASVPVNGIALRGLQFSYRYSLAIVEDDDQVRELVESEMAGSFRTATFPTGRSLLTSQDAGGNFDAYLIDWRLPDMTGTKLVEAIRQTTNAPICILTGDVTASAQIAKALDMENVNYVAKPADLLILSRTLHRAARLWRLD